jgi:trimeric autotransporter adhesin
MRRHSAPGNAQISSLILLISAQAAIAQSVSVSQLNCTPSSLTSDSTAACTVTLTGAAPVGGKEVSLSSSNTLLPLPGNSVTVPQGSTYANFAVTARSIPGNQTVTLTATALNSVLLRWGASSSSGITNYRVYRGVTNGGPYSALATVGLVTTYTDYNVQNGDKYYYVTTALSSSGTESAHSDQASAAVPAGVPQTATLSLLAPVLSSLTCDATSLLSLGATTCTVTLRNPAPAGGATVSINSNSVLLPVPVSSVTVPAGSSSKTFTAPAGTITSNQTATLKATFNGVSQTASINLLAAARLGIASLSCSPPSLESYSLTFCAVKLTAPVDTAAGITVSLSTNTSLLWVPSVATIPEGVDIAVFPAFVAMVTKGERVTVTASVNSSSASVSLTLTP